MGVKREELVGLPIRPFLFTLDQIATLIQVDEKRLRTDFVHFDHRSVGARPPDRLWAHNIAPEGQTPDWRVADRELSRWLAKRGFRIYERGWCSY